MPCTVGDGQVEVLDPEDGKTISAVRWTESTVGGLEVISPDGKRIALVLENSRVRFRDLLP